MTRALDLASLPNVSDGAVLLPIRPPAPNIGDVLQVQSISGANIQLLFTPMQAAASGALPLLGGTMLGPLLLSRDPQLANEAATRSYVDTKVTTIYNVRGGYNAATNTPTLGAGGAGGAPGDVFTVTTAGTVAFDGVGACAIGDQLQRSVTQWVKVAYSTAFGTLAFVNANNVGVISGITSLGVLNAGTEYAIPRYPNVAWGVLDGAGNLGPYVALDGTLYTGSLRPAQLNGTISGTAALTVASLTAMTRVIPAVSQDQALDPRLGTLAFAITDAAGNVSFAVDSAGAVKANLPAPTSSPTFTISNVTETAADPRQGDTAYEIIDANGRGGIAITTEGRVAFTPALGQIAGPVQQTLRRRAILTTCAWNSNASVGTDTVPTTYHAAITMETSGFDAVRLVFAVDNGAGAPFDTNIKAIVAVSSQPNDFLNPQDPTGSAASPWIPVTFNNAGAPKRWEEQTNAPGVGPRNQTLIPAPTVSSVDGSAQDALAGYTYSDWIPISSYNRIDGGRWPILMVRTYATGTGGPRSRVIPQSASGFGAMVGDRFWNLYSQAGNFVDTTAGFTPGASTGNTILFAVQYYSRARGVTVMAVGDSIVGGTGATGGIAWPVRACFALSTPAYPVVYFFPPTGIVAGSSPAAWTTNAENCFDAVLPGVFLMHVFSRNWTIDQAHADLLWQRFMLLTGRLERNGGMPVFTAPPPCPGTYTTAMEAIRKGIIARCNQCAAGSQMLWDMNNGMSQGVTPIDSWINYYTADQIHPNDRGHDAYAASIVKLIRNAIGAAV